MKTEQHKTASAPEKVLGLSRNEPLICCKTGSICGGKTRNIVIQIVLQRCCKTSCTFFVTRFTVALVTKMTKKGEKGVKNQDT